MTKNHPTLAGPFFIALLGIIFCVWSAFGNDVNFCVTTGCTLYQDFSIGGISLWWFGTAAFAILCACAFLGQPGAGKRLGAIFLLGDVGLLLLMALTAPCISCLVAALLFALCYFFFRRASFSAASKKQPAPGRSWLQLVWTLIFFVNIGQAARSQIDVWPILDESGNAHIRMFFSPSCKYCLEGINALSGNVDVAFYPVAENDSDIIQLVRIGKLLDDGMNLAEAMGKSEEMGNDSAPSLFRPDILLLRFRLLFNKAHIFASGARGVPFFEIRGLPPALMAIEKKRGQGARSRDLGSGESSDIFTPKDERLPAELDGFGECSGGQPCPPGN